LPILGKDYYLWGAGKFRAFYLKEYSVLEGFRFAYAARRKRAHAMHQREKVRS